MSKLKINTLETVDGSVSVNVADIGPATPVIDALNSTSSTAALSANKGRELNDALSGKQATLVSGTSIKTVNGISILGSGDIPVSGGGGGDVTGPASATVGTIPLFGSTSGKALVNSVYTPASFAAASHTHPSTDISDSTATGRSVLTAASAAAARTAIGAGVGDVVASGTGAISNKTTYTFASQFDAGNSGTSTTINFSNGQKQRLTLTGNATISLSFPGVGAFRLLLVQDGTGNRTVTWSGVSRYVGSATAPSINTAANSETFVVFDYDGTNVRLAASKVNA